MSSQPQAAVSVSSTESPFSGPLAALRGHWPEYAMEAFELGGFMVSACLFTILLFHPDSFVVHSIPSNFTRRVLVGLAMGATAIALIYSPFGRRSGAHFNPAVTLTFYRLGKVAKWDAVFYPVAQTVGGWLGVLAVALATGMSLSHPAVNFAATVPGTTGLIVAFIGEFVIAFVQMTMVLNVTSRAHLARYTGLFAGTLVAIYIPLEAPFSGMSMNPARTISSAIVGHVWTGLWIYLLVPPLAMLTAAELFLSTKQVPFCAKLRHDGPHCIFCEYQQWKNQQAHATAERRSLASQ